MSTNFIEVPHIVFHENVSGESRSVPCGRMDGLTERWTDVTRLEVIFSIPLLTPLKWTLTRQTTELIN